MVNPKTLSEVMRELGSSRSDKKIASSLANLEKANKARKEKLIAQLAKNRNAKVPDMKIVLNKSWNEIKEAK